MQFSTLMLWLAVASIAAFALGRGKALNSVGGPKAIRQLHSLPSYYGYYAAIWCVIPALLFMGLWLAFSETFILERVVAVLPESPRSGGGQPVRIAKDRSGHRLWS